MADDHEHFSSETREDESIHTDELYLMRDPASQRTIQAIHDLYRIDTADQQSVQRAWKRLIQRSQETVSEQVFTPHMERSEAGRILKRSDGMYRRRTSRRRWTLLAACLTAFVLLGSVVSLLTILPQGRSPQGAHVGTTTPMQQRTQTPIQLGRDVGNVALGEMIEDINVLYKSSLPEKGISPMLNLPYLRYQKVGLQIVYSDNHVIQIAVWPPFRGMTAEHFGPGMSFNQLTRTYPHFTPIKPLDLVLYQKSFPFLFPEINSGVSVDDGHGTILQVCFDANQVAMLLILQSR